MCYKYIYLQDTELLRRQALEKRLAQEEAKRAEKPKKKKKKLFWCIHHRSPQNRLTFFGDISLTK